MDKILPPPPSSGQAWTFQSPPPFVKVVVAWPLYSYVLGWFVSTFPKLSYKVASKPRTSLITPSKKRDAHLKSKRHEKAVMAGGAHRNKAKSSLYQTEASKNLSNEEEGSRLRMHVQDEVIDDYNDFNDDVEELFESLNGNFCSCVIIAI